VASADVPEKMSTDLRRIGDALIRISRLLHEHTHKLEIAVEGTYAHESSNPRVRLLSDALHVSQVADLELGRLYQSMQRLLRTMQQEPEMASPQGKGEGFEQEREALTISISHLQQERNELEMLYDIARTLNSTLEFDEVLRLVMDRIIDFLKAERGFLMLLNADTNEPEFTIGRDKRAQSMPESAFATAHISRNTVKRVIRTREPLLTDDAQSDDMLKQQESILTYGIRSIMCAPLVVRDRCIGAVYVDSRFTARLFQQKHLDLLQALCNQAAIAIDNARLFSDLNTAIRQVSEDKQYMDNIFGSIANGVVTTDATGVITTFNSSASMILGLNPVLARGKNYHEAFQTLPPQLGLIDLLQEAQVYHEHGTVVPHAVECALPTRAGDGRVSLTFYVSALRDTKGEYIGVALVIDDRTQLKRLEARAREIRHIFERYVHPSVVQQLVSDPMALNLGGETKEISVVFADIRGYTRLSENLPPGEVMHLINRYLKIMCDAIWEEEGTLTAFQGDALMAIFNAPLPQEAHALRAVRAAWKMRMAVLNYQQSQPQEVQVSFGIGVNTGMATVGNVGAQERLQNYTAIGDVVNVASRLQNNVTDNNILLNAPTYEQVYRSVRVDQPFALTVKNKSAPLTVRYLRGLA
jgi:adenylate cyclase